VPLNIPNGFMNVHLTIANVSGLNSAMNSVALGLEMSVAFDGVADFPRIANLFRDGISARYDNLWTMGPTRGEFTFAGVRYVLEDTGTEAGTHALMDNAPPAVALVVSKKTVRLGKAFRGRMYMPGVDEVKISEGGIVDGAEVNAWQASMDALRAALIADAAIVDVVLFHSVGSPEANTPTSISRLLVRNVVGTMRPRQRR